MDRTTPRTERPDPGRYCNSVRWSHGHHHDSPEPAHEHRCVRHSSSMCGRTLSPCTSPRRIGEPRSVSRSGRKNRRYRDRDIGGRGGHWTLVGVVQLGGSGPLRLVVSYRVRHHSVPCDSPPGFCSALAVHRTILRCIRRPVRLLSELCRRHGLLRRVGPVGRGVFQHRSRRRRSGVTHRTRHHADSHSETPSRHKGRPPLSEQIYSFIEISIPPCPGTVTDRKSPDDRTRSR